MNNYQPYYELNNDAFTMCGEQFDITYDEKKNELHLQRENDEIDINLHLDNESSWIIDALNEAEQNEETGDTKKREVCELFDFIIEYSQTMQKAVFEMDEIIQPLHNWKERMYLAAELHMLNAEAGNYLAYMEVLIPYLKKQPWRQFMLPIFFSLQQSFYVTMNKLFDRSGKDVEQRNIFRLIDLIDRKKDTGKLVNVSDKTVNNIQQLRNKYYAHNTGVDYEKMIKEQYIQPEKLATLQRNVALVCKMGNKYLLENTITKDTLCLQKWLPKIDELIQMEVENNSLMITTDTPNMD